MLDTIPDFVKALDLEYAMDGEVMPAWSMNGADLPWLNGFPLRLVVPGYDGTSWVRHLNKIKVLDKPPDNFWMDKAYRIPANACACVEPGQKMPSTVPISRFSIWSFLTSLANGDKLTADKPLNLRGIAFDRGYDITEVDVSADGGETWQSAALGADMGKYSFRKWTTLVTLAKGDHTLTVRATNRIPQTQPMTALWNPSGYMRNIVETTAVTSA